MNLNSAPKSKGQPLRDKLREVAANAILQASEQVFAEQGLHAAKMETIAARAGVAVGTLYNHFEDRTALLAALVEERRVALVGELDSSLATYKGEPFELGLSDFITAFIYYCESRVSLVALMVEAEPSPALRKQKAAAFEALEIRTRELVKRGIQARAIDPRYHAQSLPVLVMGLMRAAVEDSRARPQTKRTPEEWAKDISSLILKGAHS